MSETQGFKKELRPIDVWGLALGAIVGWGCFVLPGNDDIAAGQRALAPFDRACRDEGPVPGREGDAGACQRRRRAVQQQCCPKECSFHVFIR